MTDTETAQSPVKTRREGAILEVTLDRPKANAIDLKTSVVMGEVFREFRDDPELRVAIVTGGGDKFFCPGWDLKAAADGDAVDGN
ncbi:MAG: enoyl-CoA hydratase-related protein, partial [Pseudomonadota bacterium]|nr:enoyl-CoA hydratase-related protein [Pseudomonadota bacterium]